MSTRVDDVRTKTLAIVFEMLPHNKAPTMTETIMETLMPLFEKKSNTDSAEKGRSDIIYSLTHQEKVKGDTLLIAACRYQMDVLVNSC